MALVTMAAPVLAQKNQPDNGTYELPHRWVAAPTVRAVLSGAPYEGVDDTLV
jgi:hypothetical protein